MNDSNIGNDIRYLIVDENDKKYGLTINCIGFQNIKNNSNYPLTGHPEHYNFHISRGRIIDEYQFIYITEGTGVLQFEHGVLIPIIKGQVVVIFPGQWHTYYPTKEIGWNEYYIGFSGEVFDNLVQNSFFTKENQLLNVGLNEELVGLYKRAFEIARINNIVSQKHLFGIVMHMIGLILSESKSTVSVDINSKQLVETAKILMTESIFTNLRIDELSVRLDVNYATFRRRFKKITGFAPAQYFHALKIQKAKQLLLESSYSVKEISYMLCFYSPESFNLAFRKSTGKSPSKYRSICRNVAP